ncbi:Hypothetical predicted protein [Paramuricea clavata]|uniref:Uncharacterized protein n=1 Tax=Paramuricea clavata TaxID=317549 RepID=A0A7D9EFS6_PARCT|nr:Hypothetical predicted protein [Paramuricea clavata]
MSALIRSQITKNTRAKYFCDKCLDGFGRKDLLKEHLEMCLKENEKGVGKFPDKGSVCEFEGVRKMQIHPYVINADTESFLKKKEKVGRINRKKLKGSGRKHLHDHVMNSYCFHTVSTNEDRMKSETVQKTSVHELQCISDRFVDDLVAKVREFFRNTNDPLPMEEMTEDLKKSHLSETRCYKGVYPYEYMDDHEKFDMSRLPPKRFFYNGLKMEDVTDEEYERAKKFIENGIRGGISTSIMRYGTADNKYVDISEIPEGIINLMRDLNLKIRKDPTDIREKVLEFENDVCKFLWDYSQEDDDKIMRYIEKNLTRWVACLSDHGKEDDSQMTEVNPESVPVTEPEKVKDPRRVKAGKKLGAMSQEYKKAKKERLEKNLGAEVRGECMTEGRWISIERLCMIFGLGIGLGSLYLTWKSHDDKKPAKQEIIYENNNDVEKDPPKEPFDDLFD